MEMLTKIITGLDDVVAISKNLAVNEIYGASKNRIFNLGEDKYNRKLGGYTPSYKTKRKDKGLQTSFKDLTFTTNLQKSISRNDDTVYFGNEYGKKISSYQERQTATRIFAPTEEEREIFKKILNEELDKLWKS